MKANGLRIFAALMLAVTSAFGLTLGVAPTPSALAATTITVTPDTGSWFFTDDSYPGGIGELVAGPGTPPLGSGSVHMALVGTAREAYGTAAHAGTRLDQITNLQYSTYRSSADAGNNLAIALQFDMDYDLTDTNTVWQGRLVYEPYFSFPGDVLQNTWQTWNPLTGKWWASGAPGNTVCPQSAPCTWAQVLAAFPDAGLRVGVGMTWLKAGGPADGFNGNADALTIGVSGSDTTYDFETGLAHLFFFPSSASMAVGGGTTLYLNLNSITNLYGYQFQVNYNASNVSAVGSFVNSFFNTVGGAIPTGWNADCISTPGVCKFAVSKQAPAGPVTGSGTLAQIVFTGVASGIVPLTFSGDILGDRDGNAILHTVGTATLTVNGSATVSGQVNLQGRALPGPHDTLGKVTLTTAGFPATVATIAADGTWSAVVPVAPGGSTYQLDAAHSLYLGNQMTHALDPGDVYAAPATKLLGGDADNSGKVELFDLTCIGGAFGGAPTICGTTGSSDINADGTVNILDLVLAGGNFDLTTPQGW